MSTYWGYYCKDCQIKSEDTWLNHGERRLAKFAHVWKNVKPLLYGSEVYLTVVDVPECYIYDINGFLEEHSDHDIVLINEYDRIENIEDWLD